MRTVGRICVPSPGWDVDTAPEIVEEDTHKSMCERSIYLSSPLDPNTPGGAPTISLSNAYTAPSKAPYTVEMTRRNKAVRSREQSRTGGPDIKITFDASELGHFKAWLTLEFETVRRFSVNGPMEWDSKHFALVVQLNACVYNWMHSSHCALACVASPYRLSHVWRHRIDTGWAWACWA